MSPRFLLAMGLAMLFVSAVPASGQQTPEELYQSALYKQQVEGDLGGAIQILQALVEDFADHREIAASALVLLGHLHETLGSTNAEEAYRRVLDDYPDQRAAAEEARARLDALTRPASPAPTDQRVVRVLLSDEDTDPNHFRDMRLSPDGRRVVYTDAGYTGDVYIRDLASGDTTKVADGWAYTPIWSADGTKIAYGVVPGDDPDGSTLHILDLATGEDSVPPSLVGPDLSPYAWSPDGDLLACWIGGGDAGEDFLGLVSLGTGHTTRLASFHARTSADFSPDGRYVAFSDVVGGNLDVYLTDVMTEARHRITTGPGQESRPLWAPSGDVLIYTGPSGTWALPMDGGTPTGVARLLSAEQYRQPAGWTESGQLFYVGYNIRRQRLQVPVDPESMAAAGPPEPFPAGGGPSRAFRWSPDMQKVAIHSWQTVRVYSFEDDVVRPYQLGPEHQAQTLEWGEDGTKVLIAGRGGGARGEDLVVAELDLVTGETREVFGPISDVAGWFRISKDGEKLTFYRGDPNAPEMQLVLADLRTGDRVVLADETKMEDGTLDRWVRPQLSPDGSQVLFGTRDHELGGRDSRCQLWVTPADGSGEPHRIAAAYWIPYATWHPKGTHVAYNTWVENEVGPGNLYVVDVRTGEGNEIALPSGLQGLQVHDWSPDGNWIGIVNTAGGYELLAVENVLGSPAGEG